ncbi:hypothetical protein V8E36_009878 [Tilletia maclaganii]
MASRFGQAFQGCNLPRERLRTEGEGESGDGEGGRRFVMAWRPGALSRSRVVGRRARLSGPRRASGCCRDREGDGRAGLDEAEEESCETEMRPGEPARRVVFSTQAGGVGQGRASEGGEAERVSSGRTLGRGTKWMIHSCEAGPGRDEMAGLSCWRDWEADDWRWHDPGSSRSLGRRLLERVRSTGTRVGPSVALWSGQG